MEFDEEFKRTVAACARINDAEFEAVAKRVFEDLTATSDIVDSAPLGAAYMKCYSVISMAVTRSVTLIPQCDGVALTALSSSLSAASSKQTEANDAPIQDAAEVAFSSYFEENGCSAEKVACVSRLFAANKNRLLKRFSRVNTTKSSISQLADVSWRVDYVLKDSRRAQLDELRVLVDLQHTKAAKLGEEDDRASQLEHTRFLCTQEQLQDLVFKLKEAYKTFENAAKHTK